LTGGRGGILADGRRGRTKLASPLEESKTMLIQIVACERLWVAAISDRLLFGGKTYRALTRGKSSSLKGGGGTACVSLFASTNSKSKGGGGALLGRKFRRAAAILKTARVFTPEGKVEATFGRGPREGGGTRSGVEK